jgi:hypothetical protein
VGGARDAYIVASKCKRISPGPENVLEDIIKVVITETVPRMWTGLIVVKLCVRLLFKMVKKFQVF